MEENKKLTEEEEELVDGGTSIALPTGSQLYARCPQCGSYNVSAKPLHTASGGRRGLALHCNECGNIWTLQP